MLCSSYSYRYKHRYPIQNHHPRERCISYTTLTQPHSGILGMPGAALSTYSMTSAYRALRMASTDS